MIRIKEISDIDDNVEGKLLIAAMAILTTIDHKQIESGDYGGMTTPFVVLDKVVDLANRIYYEEEYKSHKKSIFRDTKIDKLLT